MVNSDLNNQADQTVRFMETRRTKPRVRLAWLLALPIPIGLASILDLPESAAFRARPENSEAIAARPEVAVAVSRSRADEPLAEKLPTEIGRGAKLKYPGTSTQRSRAAKCLAAAAWYEAGDDPVWQRAVIQTVVNRVKHPAFPDSVCGVVFEGSHLASGCQFTFTCDGSLSDRQPSQSAWNKAIGLAEEALGGFVDRSIGAATHYHAEYVSPWWSTKLEHLTNVGPHLFYRWPGDQSNLNRRVQLQPEREYEDLVEASYHGSSSGAVTKGDAGPTPHVEARLDAALTEAPNTRPMHAGMTEFMTVEGNHAAGRWAVLAMDACGKKNECRIVGYGDTETRMMNEDRPYESRDRPLFLFIRDRASGMNLALWDCDRLPRADQEQCLPSSRAAVMSLVADR